MAFSDKESELVNQLHADTCVADVDEFVAKRMV